MTERLEVMSSFIHYNPTKILFGKNQLEELKNLIPRNYKVILLSGEKSAEESGLLNKIRNILSTNDLYEFKGIKANPEISILDEAVKIINKNQVDFILAVGGGSVIDGAKYIACAALFEGNPRDIFGEGIGDKREVKKALPFGTVLTFPATSTEWNNHAVISFKDDKAKIDFFNDYTYPSFSILDPENTYSLSKKQIYQGICDAFVHVIEQYLTYPVNSMVQDAYAESLLRLLIEVSEKFKIEEELDYSLRANYMWVISNCLNNFIGLGVPEDWSTHYIGHEITALNETDHSYTLSAILPTMLRCRKEEKREKLLQYAKNVWNLEGEDEEIIIQSAITYTEEFFKSLNLPIKLSDINVKREDIEIIIHALEKHEMINLSERFNLTSNEIKNILITSL